MPPPPAGPGKVLTPGQQLVRHELARRLAVLVPRGPTVALLAGDCGLGPLLPGVLISDRRPGPEVELVCDPEALPLPPGQLTGLCGLDVLGRCPRPARVLMEAERALRPGGRLVLVEPWTGLLGTLVHRLAGRPVRAGLDPWFDAFRPGQWTRGNAAAPRACLDSRAAELERHVPRLRLRAVEPFAGLAEVVALRPAASLALVRRALQAEDRLPEALRHLTGSRAAVVLERF